MGAVDDQCGALLADHALLLHLLPPAPPAIPLAATPALQPHDPGQPDQRRHQHDPGIYHVLYPALLLRAAWQIALPVLFAGTAQRSRVLYPTGPGTAIDPA